MRPLVEKAPQAPVFQEKFGDTAVESEGTIRLVARIHGVPAPDVTWSRWEDQTKH